MSETRLGRPPDSRIDGEIVAAVLRELKKKGGYRAVTIEGIARGIGCARSSVYRRWPSKRHLVAFAVMREMGPHPAPDTGSLRGDFAAVVENLSKAFAGPLRLSLAGLLADMAGDAKLATLIRAQVLETRRASMRAAINRAIKRAEIDREIDVELSIDMLTAPFYFRVLFAHQPITATMRREVVDYVLRALSYKNSRGPQSRDRARPLVTPRSREISS